MVVGLEKFLSVMMKDIIVLFLEEHRYVKVKSKNRNLKKYIVNFSYLHICDIEHTKTL